MHVIADGVQQTLRLASLRREHPDHALHRGIADRVHDVALIGRAIGAPLPRLGGGFRTQDPVDVSPLRDRQPWRRTQNLRLVRTLCSSAAGPVSINGIDGDSGELGEKVMNRRCQNRRGLGQGGRCVHHGCNLCR